MMDKQPRQHHRIKNLTVSGGFLDGLQVDLTSGLNCFIGSRGTGKTTVLEFVRYALDQMPSDATSKKRLEALVQKNLGNGCIRLTIETKDCLTYIVSRMAGDEVIVRDSKGQTTDISLASSGIFKANIFSQNDVESIADNPMDQLRLLDTFKAEALREIDGKIKQLMRTLTANAHDCIDIQKRMASVADELNTLPGIDAKLAEFTAATGGDAAEINQAQHQKALRDRERRALEETKTGLRTLSNDVAALSGKFERQLTPLNSRDIQEGENSALIQSLIHKLRADSRTVERLLQDAQKCIEEGLRTVEDTASKISTAHRTQDGAFQDLLTKHKEVQSQSSERSNLERLRNELLSKKRVHEENADKLTRLRAKRAELLSELTTLRNHRFDIRRTIAVEISADVNPQIRVKVEQFGNNEVYQDLLERSLKGAGIQHTKVAQKIAARVPPNDFVELVRARTIDSLAARAELNAEQARRTIDAVAESGMLFEIETVEMPDLPCIELLDGGEYKNSLNLSTGQKCTSILPILLRDSVAPLFIDQPEDNLDNRFIYTTVVKRLREVKHGRQLVFITHNPNIPVLGDAERVVVLKSSGALATKVKEGSVEDCKLEIVTILEGGEEAFKERRKRYSY